MTYIVKLHFLLIKSYIDNYEVNKMCYDRQFKIPWSYTTLKHALQSTKSFWPSTTLSLHLIPFDFLLPIFSSNPLKPRLIYSNQLIYQPTSFWEETAAFRKKSTNHKNSTHNKQGQDRRIEPRSLSARQRLPLNSTYSLMAVESAMPSSS